MDFPAWMHWAAVAVGCGVGSVLRVELVRRLDSTAFPSGTLFANLSGAFGAGCVLGAHAGTLPMGHPTLSFLLFGFFGGLTTVSSYAAQVEALWSARKPRRCVVYALATPSLCMGLALLGAGLMLLLTGNVP